MNFLDRGLGVSRCAGVTGRKEEENGWENDRIQSYNENCTITAAAAWIRPPILNKLVNK